MAPMSSSTSFESVEKRPPGRSRDTIEGDIPFRGGPWSPAGGAPANASQENVGTITVQPASSRPSTTAAAPSTTWPNDRSDE